MLVYFSKGLVNIQHNLTQAVIQKGVVTESSTGLNKYMLSLYTRVDLVNEGTPIEMSFTYDLSDKENYEADFKLLKDCFLNACRQQNISVFSTNDVSQQSTQQQNRSNMNMQQIINARYAPPDAAGSIASSLLNGVTVGPNMLHVYSITDTHDVVVRDE